MIQKPEVYSIAAMLYSDKFQKDLADIAIASGIQEILAASEDDLKFCDPHDYHLTISYLEVRIEDWSENILHKIYQVISSSLKNKQIILPFVRLGILYKYFFAEYANDNLLEFKQELLKSLQKEIPQGIYGFETEYFPHITVARFNPLNIPKIIKRELISTCLRGVELKQPEVSNSAIIDANCILKVNARLQESNFL